MAAAEARGASARDAVGGEVMNVATLSLSAPLAGAKLREAGVRAHLFSSVGGLHAMHTLRGDAGTSAEVAANLMRGTRVCVGAGLLVPTPMGRLELSLTKVLKRQGPNPNPNPNPNHNHNHNPSPNPSPNSTPNSTPNPNRPKSTLSPLVLPTTHSY